VDILVRTYLVFLGTVMAHEGVHGHLGSTRRSNFAWGRIALIPSLVPFTNFRRTHHLHHAHTNEPDQDPDYFMKPRSAIEIPFRALAMPHQWYFWLKRRNLLDRKHRREVLLNYALIAAVFGGITAFVGPARVAWGVGPVLVFVSVLLWYPFALKTHEGHSVGAPETRSHDYYGRLLYWFSLGLSMHRVHHEKPQLTWIELKSYVQPAPEGSWGGLVPRRDVKRPVIGSASRPTVGSGIAALLAIALLASPAEAQWRALSTTGYAAGGLVAATPAAFAAHSYEGGLTTLVAGLMVGAAAGWLIGDSAADALDRGEPLSGKHKNALRAGTVLTGAAIGGLGSFLVINGEAPGGAGGVSDETIFTSFVAVGAALGVVTQVMLESRLQPAGLAVAPTVLEGNAPALLLTLEL
jgi:hypothetical protein